MEKPSGESIGSHHPRTQLGGVWICGGALGENMVTPQSIPNHTERCMKIRSRVTRAPRSSRELPPECGQKNNTLSTRPALLLQVKRNCSSDRCLVRAPYLYPLAGGVAGGVLFHRATVPLQQLGYRTGMPDSGAIS